MSERLTEANPKLEHQLVLERMAFEAINDDNIQWLKEDFKDIGDTTLRSLERVLMAAYAYDRAHTELRKKAAQQILGAEHPKTARQYANYGIEAGYLISEKSDLDSRAHAVRPTEKLIKKIELELSRRAAKQTDLIRFKEGLATTD